MIFTKSVTILLICGVSWVQGYSIHRSKGFGRKLQTERTVGSTIHFGGDSPSSPSYSSSMDATRSSMMPLDSEPGLDPNYQRYQRNFDPFGSASEMSTSYASYGEYPDIIPGSAASLDWSSSPSSNNDEAPVANFARGSSEGDSFMVQSAPTRPKKYNRGPQSGNRVNFGQSSSIDVSSSYAVGGDMRRRSKRSLPQQQMIQQRRGYPPMYGHMNNYAGGYGGYGHQQQNYAYEEPEEDCYYHTLVNGDSEMLLRMILPVRLRGRTIVRKCIPKTPNINDPRYKVLLRGNQQSSFGHMSVSAKL